MTPRRSSARDPGRCGLNAYTALTCCTRACNREERGGVTFAHKETAHTPNVPACGFCLRVTALVSLRAALI
ncbi:hypothetical protein Sm713_19060 [Streptomyces sp. TS71-3]|nr:hypothetical protein Sm713_19060 [Streptomyces sp. TS71-3]